MIRKRKIFHRPWGLKEGLAIGAGLIATSAAVQAISGPVELHHIAWPVNIILLVLFTGILCAMHVMRKKMALFGWLGSAPGAVSALTFAVAATVVLGIADQRPGGTGTIRMSDLMNSWTFAALYIWLVTSLGLATIRVAAGRWTWHKASFLLNHAGLFIVLAGGGLGAADVRQLTMIAGCESLGYGPAATAHDDDTYRSVDLDFAIVLKSLDITYSASDSTHPNPLPENFTSHVRILTKGEEGIRLWGDTIIRVNEPLRVNGWDVYQYGYEGIRGKKASHSIFGLVRDPWLAIIYAGMIMMLAGALTLPMTTRKKPELQ